MDSIRNYKISKQNGFVEYKKDLENCYFNFEKIDNYQHGIHDYFKFLKFGFGRANRSIELCVRRGILKRKEALEIVKLKEGKFPKIIYGKENRGYSL